MRVCMITYSFYESDGRVLRYAEALAERGDEVTVLALRRSPSLPTEARIKGVRVIRLGDRFGKTERSKASYLIPILKFMMATAHWLAREDRKAPFDFVHVHNMPDFLVFSAWRPRLRGAPIVLDIHDILPEFFVAKFGVSDRSVLARLLRLVERASARFARHVIVANDLWMEKYQARSARQGQCSVFINHVDESLFRPSPRSELRPPRILFPGSLNAHQGVDLAIRAFARVHDAFPEARFDIYGDGPSKDELVGLTRDLGLSSCVHFHDTLPLEHIAIIMADADVGVVPKRADSFGNEAYSTKIMEFMSVGVPVVVSETRIDRHYFNDDVVRFFESGNVDALAEAILALLRDPGLRSRTVAAAGRYAKSNSWTTRKQDYLRLVDTLCSV